MVTDDLEKIPLNEDISIILCSYSFYSQLQSLIILPLMVKTTGVKESWSGVSRKPFGRVDRVILCSMILGSVFLT